MPTTAPQTQMLASVTIAAPMLPGYDEILSAEAAAFLAELHETFEARRKELLTNREKIQERFDKGQLPYYPDETVLIRNNDWKIAPVPADLLDRRVEITGPVDRKMIINAMNSGAKVFMADFEDSNAPCWTNNVQGQLNLRDAINRRIDFTTAEGKTYTLSSKPATLMVRPRGWHLSEKHFLVNDEPISASLFDFGLYFFHNAETLIKNGSGPYFYLPKMESYHEARLWNDVFVFAQERRGIPNGTIKATVLIETIYASFQLHEILWELRDHSAGLNCGRWDYIFSFIKKFRNRKGFVLPERGQVTMSVPFMRSYCQLVIQTCHRRGAHAMGGMAAQIPIKNNPAANEQAMEKVRNDKLREVREGHDGTWVAHPALVPIAMEIFDRHMTGPNQLHLKRKDVKVDAQDLIEIPQGTITEAGLRLNINVGILYIESWLRGNGAAAIYNLMEDAATAEISRTQVWQWIKNGAKLDDGRTITLELYEDMRDDEIEKIKNTVGSLQYQQGQFVQAICVFNRLVVQEEFEEFLTLPAYELILSNNHRKLCMDGEYTRRII